VDIREALEAAGIEVHDGSTEDEIRICCPFCMEEGEPSLDERYRLGINTSTGAAQCFNCSKRGYGSWIVYELQRVLDTGDMELAQETRKKKHKRKKVMLPEGYELLHQPNGHDGHQWNTQAWRYVRRRGVTEKQITSKKIGYTTIGDYHHRIVAPIYRHTKLLGFVGRDITDKMELKYLNSVGDKAIYNLPDSTHHRSICLSEGFFDALAIERGSLKLGIDSGALLGHDIKDEQLELILHMGYKYLYLWLDPDEAGVKGTIKIAKKLEGKRVFIVLPKGFSHEGANDQDPGDFESNIITSRLRDARKCTPELLDQLRAWMAFDE
jgi:DNA primase